MLFASYFFLSSVRTNHMRKVYNIIDLLSNLGGILTTFFGLGRVFATYINKKLFITKMME